MAIDVDTLLRGLDRGGWLPLSPPGRSQPMVPESLLPEGDGVLVSSGGSSGGRQICLQPWNHLDQSAAAAASWLEGIGLDPSETLLLNPLPLHHVSGLMPWWRSRCWGARHLQLSPSLMKSPADLLQVCEALPDWGHAPAVVSLVPTQLHRLMAAPAGLAWLKACAVIWVGGAALPDALADHAVGAFGKTAIDAFTDVEPVVDANFDCCVWTEVSAQMSSDVIVAENIFLFQGVAIANWKTRFFKASGDRDASELFRIAKANRQVVLRFTDSFHLVAVVIKAIGVGAIARASDAIDAPNRCTDT